MTKTNKIFFQTFIDPEQWDKAFWLATAFMQDPEATEPPLLGLVFQNIESAREIFSHWRNRLGETDRYNELRIAIVEGDIPARDPGYSIHISSDPQNTADRLSAEGEPLHFDTAILMSRVLRMNQQPGGSPHLARFKSEFAKHNKYYILPISKDLDPQFDLAIEKTVVHFRQSSEVTQSDVDSAVFPEGTL